MSEEDFYTFRGYMMKEWEDITPSMEDYIEMIYRLSQKKGYTRTKELSEKLNVQPPSVTKMIKRMDGMVIVNYEKYGVITLSQRGKNIGKALLHRHMIIEEFLGAIAPTEDVFEQTEKIEHSISEKTIWYFEQFLKYIKEDPEIINEFHKKIGK
ncbi:metal-dependent transcriptional regulator [Clostridium sp. DL1XJH146]